MSILVSKGYLKFAKDLRNPRDRGVPIRFIEV